MSDVDFIVGAVTGMITIIILVGFYFLVRNEIFKLEKRIKVLEEKK